MRKNKDTLIRLGNFLASGKFSNAIEVNSNTGFENELEYASRHLILPSIYFRSHQYGTLSLFSGAEKTYLINIADLCRARTRQILNQVKEITLALNNAGIKHVYLKGIANMLDGLYVEEAERVVSDIDLLVDPQQCTTAIKILDLLGYAKEGGLDARPPDDAHHFPAFFKDDEPCRIELHIAISRKTALPLLSGGEILLYAIEVNHCGISYFIPSAKHRVMHNFIHCQYNNFYYKNNFLDLRQLFDFHLLIVRYKDKICINKIISELPSRETRNALETYCVHAEKLLKTPVPENVLNVQRSQFKHWLVLMLLDASTGLKVFLHYSSRLHRLPLRLATPAWYGKKIRYLKTPRKNRDTLI